MVEMTKETVPQPTGRTLFKGPCIAYTNANERVTTEIAQFIRDNELKKKQWGGIMHVRWDHDRLSGYKVYSFGCRDWLCPLGCEPWKDKQHLHKAILM